MQSIFSNPAPTELGNSGWLIAESTENLAMVANADGLYATVLPTLLVEEWPLR